MLHAVWLSAPWAREHEASYARAAQRKARPAGRSPPVKFVWIRSSPWISIICWNFGCISFLSAQFFSCCHFFCDADSKKASDSILWLDWCLSRGGLIIDKTLPSRSSGPANKDMANMLSEKSNQNQMFFFSQMRKIKSAKKRSSKKKGSKIWVDGSGSKFHLMDLIHSRTW